MNRDRLEGICRQVRGQMREQWGKLSVDPQSTVAGIRDRLAGRIQEQRGIVKESTARELKEFLVRNRHWRRLSGR